MVYTIKERRAAFVGLLVCLGYILLICIQLGLYADKELDNYEDPGYWTVMFFCFLILSSIVTTIRLYYIIHNLSCSVNLKGLLIASHICTFIFMCLAESSLIYYGLFQPTTPLQYHVFVWFVIWSLLISLFIVWVIYRACKICLSLIRSCVACCSLRSRKFYQLFTNYSDPKCSICLLEMIDFEDLENEHQQTIKTLSCGHGFHRHCIDDWTELNNSCPICQNQVIQVEDNVAIPPEGDQAIPA